MRTIGLMILLVLAAWAMPAAEVRADDFGFGITIRDEGRKSFLLAAGAHFKMGKTSIGFAVKQGVPDEELPVVFYLASRARVKPEVLIAMRRKGKSWAAITLHFGLGAGIYHVPLKVVSGPPYGNAYGHFKKHPKGEWNKIIFPDRDIVNLVNLRFMSAHYGITAEKVLELRAKGRNFVAVNGAVKLHLKQKGLKAHAAKPRIRAKVHARKAHKGSKGGGGRKGKK